jgi:hypothetical protein
MRFCCYPAHRTPHAVFSLMVFHIPYTSDPTPLLQTIPQHLFDNELNPDKTVYSTQNKILY